MNREPVGIAPSSLDPPYIYGMEPAERSRKSKKKKAKGIRLFVALYPPAEHAADYLAALRDLDLPEHRLTPVEQVHCTLQFIGNTDPREIEHIAESVDRSVAGLEPFELCAMQLITLPPKRHSRLIAMEFDQPAPLLEIKRRLAQRLATSPRPDPADRFLPHMTLARFRKPTRWSLPQTAAVSTPGFVVTQIALMKSTLSPSGARHELVHAAEIP